MDDSKQGEMEKIFLDYQKKMKDLDAKANLIFKKYLEKIEEKKTEELRNKLKEKDEKI